MQISDFVSALADPHSRHAILVHMPIVLGMLGVLPVLAWLIGKGKSRSLGLVAAACFLLASAGAGMAVSAGEEAEERVEQRGPLSAAEKVAMDRHEELGENGWVWPLIPGVLMLLAAATPRPKIALSLGSLATLGGLGVAGWIALTAHAGGELVYVHGLGVPARGAGPALAVPAPQKNDDDD